MATALALTGGSIKGAFQAGALEVVLEKKTPQFISGISVGSLNAFWLACNAGKTPTANWPALGRGLTDFWKARVTKPSDLVKKRFVPWLVVNTLFEQFNGLTDTGPLRMLVEETMGDGTALRRTPITLKIGAVDYYEGNIHYVDQHAPRDRLIEYVMGSSAIPVAMPPSMIEVAAGRRRPFFDGALRDLVPLKEAMQSGAEEVIVIGTHSRDIEKPLDAPSVNHRNLLTFSERLAEIMLNESLNMDLEYACEINELLEVLKTPPKSKLLDGKKVRKLVVIRPKEPLDATITDFDAGDIENMMRLGRERAREVLDSGQDSCAEYLRL